MRNIFIDSDIILDLLLGRDTFSLSAQTIIRACEKGTLDGFTSIIVIANVHYFLTKQFGHHESINKIGNLTKILDLVITDKQQLLHALQSDFSDFEDALQYFTAKESSVKIDAIITRNTKDYKGSEIPVLSPTEFVGIVGL